MEASTIMKEIDSAVISDRNSPINILAVEDDPIVVTFLSDQIKRLGHNMHTAENGQVALTLLEAHQDETDVILMDWEMPVMNGLTAIKHIKNNPSLRHIPIVMLTGADKPEEIKKGLEAGVFYYLTKPVPIAILRSVLNSAVQAARQNKTLSHELKQHRMGFKLIESCKFKFHTLDEAESLSIFISNCFPNPERVLPGLGELMINALEHGNLKIGYDEKSKLVESDTWRMEIEKRQQLPQYDGKFVTVTVARKDNGIYAVIEDQGEGFNWEQFMDIDPSCAGKRHGRGIAQANAVSFDKLTYNEKGNQAIAFVKYDEQLDW